MSEIALKRNSCWFRGKCQKIRDVKKSKSEELYTISYSGKYVMGLESCSFVEKCIQIAEQKKIFENALKYSKASKDFSYPSMFKKF